MREIKGKTSKEMYGVIEPSVMEEKKHYPMFDISLDNLPEAKNWKPGEIYKLGIKVRMKSIRDDADRSNGNASFEVRGIEIQKISKKKRESRYS